jgi:hypothetical protein
VFDENATHRLGSRTIEMPPIVPCHLSGVLFTNQSKICLMNECGRLQRVAATLVVDSLLRDRSQLSVHLVKQGALGVGLPGRHLLQQSRDLVGLTWVGVHAAAPCRTIIARHRRFS